MPIAHAPLWVTKGINLETRSGLFREHPQSFVSSAFYAILTPELSYIM